MSVLIKGQPIDAWLSWIDNELTPPITVDDQVKYTLEGFKEALEFIKNKT